MKRIAGFLVLTSIASGCDRGASQDKSPETVAAKVHAEPAAKAIAAGHGPTKEIAGDDAQKSEVEAPVAPGATTPSDVDKAPAATSAAAGTKIGQPGAEQRLVTGAAVSGEGFKIQLQTLSPQVVGKPGHLIVTLEASAPYKCNEKYPYKFKFEPVDGVSFPNETVRGMDVKKDSASMSVPFSPQSAGNQSVSGDLSFSVCTDDKCLVEKQRLTVSFDVLDAS